jgi:hypothetical protein
MGFFIKINGGLNAKAPNFWHDHINCYDVNIVMRQNDLMFINVLSEFRWVIHTIEDIDTTNNLCLKGPPKDLTIIYLFHTNKKVIAHNDQVFLNPLHPKNSKMGF